MAKGLLRDSDFSFSHTSLGTQSIELSATGDTGFIRESTSSFLTPASEVIEGFSTLLRSSEQGRDSSTELNDGRTNGSEHGELLTLEMNEEWMINPSSAWP
jgi:hypothetical protein